MCGCPPGGHHGSWVYSLSEKHMQLSDKSVYRDLPVKYVAQNRRLALRASLPLISLGVTRPVVALRSGRLFELFQILRKTVDRICGSQIVVSQRDESPRIHELLFTWAKFEVLMYHLVDISSNQIPFLPSCSHLLEKLDLALIVSPPHPFFLFALASLLPLTVLPRALVGFFLENACENS